MARVSWREVLGVVQSDQGRSMFVNRYRASGFTPEDFGRSILAPRASGADALTAVEDWLELQRGSKAETERAAIRAIRRRLEVEACP